MHKDFCILNSIIANHYVMENVFCLKITKAPTYGDLVELFPGAILEDGQIAWGGLTEPEVRNMTKFICEFQGLPGNEVSDEFFNHYSAYSNYFSRVLGMYFNDQRDFLRKYHAEVYSIADDSGRKQYALFGGNFHYKSGHIYKQEGFNGPSLAHLAKNHSFDRTASLSIDDIRLL
mmetsp:Transcript_17177/g.17093  ORF Transcript_17177/g.17093 Transcript_17177/m.17093 type:complete len:175 (+) Transcript_17177:507-1031(+)